jgi:heptaprenyl diphosphate synthase
MNNRTKKLTFLALAASTALVLSFLESLLPPLYAALPAIKMGLPNIVIIFVLYRLGVKEAVCVSFVRILCVALLFGNVVMLAYSIAGAVLSITSMALLKQTRFVSTIGVSICGGVMHNLGQILMAIFILDTIAIGFYFPVLVISGSAAGVLVGIVSAILLKKLKNKSI